MEKKHQMEACSMRLSVMKLASSGPDAHKNTPWMIMPFFSYSAKNGANMRKLWMAAPGT